MNTLLKTAFFAVIFLWTLPIFGQMPDVNFNVEIATPIEFEGRQADFWPEIISNGVDNDGEEYVLVSCEKIKSWTGIRLNIFKLRVSDGKELFKVILERIEFRDKDLYFEDLYVHNDEVHLLYRTEKENEDSVYLLDRTITAKGVLKEPRVLLASWIEYKDEDDNIEFNWNEDKSSLTVLAVQRDKVSDNGILVRAVFDASLNRVSKNSYLLNEHFEEVELVETNNILGKSYAFLAIYGEAVKTGVVELDGSEMRLVGAAPKHEYVRSITLHSVGDKIHLSYLHFDDDDYDHLNGFTSSILDFEKGQIWTTDEDYRKVIEKDNSFASFFFEEAGRFGIKSIIENPQGGFIVTIHKTYAVSSELSRNYYSSDYIITMVNENNVAKNTHLIPAKEGSINSGHLNNMVAFTESGDYVIFYSDEDEPQKLKAAILSNDGAIQFHDIYESNEALLTSSERNYSRIGKSNEYFSYLFLSGNDSQLVRIKITGIDENAPKVKYEPLKYGTQY